MPAETFKEFIEVCCEGSQAKAAEKLGLDKSHISRLCKGERGITPALAARIEQESGGRYSKESLIWPDEQAA